MNTSEILLKIEKKMSDREKILASRFNAVATAISEEAIRSGIIQTQNVPMIHWIITMFCATLNALEEELKKEGYSLKELSNVVENIVNEVELMKKRLNKSECN